jgi:hypothetical protein
MKNKKGLGRKANLALAQIIILLVSTISIGYVIGLSNVPLVSAQAQNSCIQTPDGIIWLPSPLPDAEGGHLRQVNDPPISEVQTRTTGGGEGSFCSTYGGSFCTGSGTRIRESVPRIPCSSDVVAGAPPTTPSPTTGGDPFTRSVGERLALRQVTNILTGGGGDDDDDDDSEDSDESSGGGIGDFIDAVLRAKLAETVTVKNLITNAAYAVGIYYGTKIILSQFTKDAELANSLALATSGGYLAGSTLPGLFGSEGTLFGMSPTVVGFVAGAIIFLATYKQTRYEAYQFSCSPWQPASGGADCERCNNQEFPCTEYQCKSLGQACELINKGTTQELCVWDNRNDIIPPVIQPWESILTEGYSYNPISASSPQDRGVRIVPLGSSNGCIAPYTPLKFGATLDEPGRCKIDVVDKRSFEEMNWFFGGSSTLKYNHTQVMSLPSLEALEGENITLQNGGEYIIYTRCEDKQGNSNTANFVFSFCVDEGPDETAPLIVTTSILNGMPVSANQTSVDLRVYVNEPAECRWSQVDQSYDNMITQMTCNTGVTQMNAQGLYQCSTTLTGLKDRQNNDFYFRCKDKPNAPEVDRVANSESYKFTLIGTQPLVLDSVSPESGELIKDSTSPVRVTLEARTSAGYDEGESICSFKEAGSLGSYNEFFNTGTHQHSQDLFLPGGTYSYDIKCVDLGGNADTATTSFSVETDTAAPLVVRAFNQENQLKIITNEPASCVYDTVDCSYELENGEPMSTSDDIVHTVSWDPERSFYVKCEDEFGNRPNPNQCSIIVRPFSN